MKGRGSLLVACLTLFAVSCATAIFVRSYEYRKGVATQTLSVWGDSFRLERSAEDGLTQFTGGFTNLGEEWAFDIETWKPPDGPTKTFSPPVRFVCRVKRFKTAVSFLRVTGPPDVEFQFIPRGDFYNK